MSFYAITVYHLEPEVPGALGQRTEMDNSVHPPDVRKLNVIFDGWLGDQLIECFPCYLVSESLAQSLVSAGFTGFELADAEIETSSQFEELYPGRELPAFHWLKVTGTSASNDIYITGDHRLAVGEKAFEVILRTEPKSLEYRQALCPVREPKSTYSYIATLLIRHPEILPGTITETLSIEPTTTFPPRPDYHTYWDHTFRLRTDADVPEFLAGLIQDLVPHQTFLQNIRASGGSVGLWIFLMELGRRLEIPLPHHLLRSLGDFGISIEFSLNNHSADESL